MQLKEKNNQIFGYAGQPFQFRKGAIKGETFGPEFANQILFQFRKGAIKGKELFVSIGQQFAFQFRKGAIKGGANL